MADERTHMAADLATALADPNGPAVDIVLDGVPLRAFVQDLAFQDCPYEGVVLERKGIVLLYGVIPKPDSQRQMSMGSIRYMVESSLHAFPALEIILTRFAS